MDTTPVLLIEASKTEILSWFETDDFPTEAQFRATWNSFWHKSESLPISSISGLTQRFTQTVTNAVFNNHLSDENAHSAYLAKIDASNINVAAWQAALGTGSSDLSNYYTKNEVYNKSEIDSKLTSVYKSKGSVANFAALPTTGNIFGDVWNLISNGDNYVWVADLNSTGVAGWDKLSGIVDLSAYHTITQYQSYVAANYVALANLITAWSATASNTKIPSEKLVKDAIQPQLYASYTAATSITNATLIDGKTINGRNLLLDIGTNTLTFTINTVSEGNFCLTGTKIGASSINFVAGTGVTIIQADGTLSVNGATYSSFKIEQIGTTVNFILSIFNR